MFEALRTGLDEVERLLADTVPTTDEVAELVRLGARLEGLQAMALGRWDGEKVWSETGAKSGAAALAHRTRHSKVACASKVALGRTMRKLPVAASAFVAGEISADHVRVLSKARNKRTATCMERDEAVLVEQAGKLSFQKFRGAVDYWSLRADPDGTTENALKQRDRHRLSIMDTIGGSVLSGFLDTVSSEIVRTELERLAEKLYAEDRAEAKLRLGRDPLAHELRRTRGQRWAAALVVMAERSKATGDVKPARPLFTVVLGDESMRNVCELEASGRVIPPGALAEWFDTALLEVVVLGDGGRDVAVSRKRSFTGAVRRILEVRDRECFHETCEDPPQRCQGDHIERYTDGGVTSHENGQLACGFHNRHRRGPPQAA
jgi:hypothetical protein